MSVAVATTEADRQACYALRFEVFVDEQGVTPETEIDAEDATATHLLLRRDGVALGTLRILYDGADARIGRVCVRKSARGSGLGAELMRAALRVIADGPRVDKIRLSAQLSVVGFYRTLGFAAYGSVYDDERIPHQAMERPMEMQAG